MDTNTNETPVGSDGATSSPDTDSAVTQPEETNESVSDGEVVESGEATELLAGKYKSPQELEKAYKELESKLGEVGQKAELANLLEKNTGMSHQQIKDYLARQEQQQMQAQYQANPGAYAYQEVQALKGQIALQNEEKELDKFLSSEEGKAYAPFKDKIFKLGLNLEKDKSYEDIAKEYFGESRAQGQKDAYKKIEVKKQTQTTGSVSTPQKKFSAEDLKGMTAEEMKAILPHAQRRE